MTEVHDNGGTQNHSLKKLQIVAVTSVKPAKETESRQVRQVLVSDDHSVHPRTIDGCYQIVLYYEKLNEEERSWCLAGWIVESLTRALMEHPLLAGRLQRRGGVGGDTHKCLEIVSNDSGIRFLEARYPTSLSQFLELNKKEHLEAELVFWKEIDDQCLEFSPLVYIQVTNFECGGYSIGISCSLLLAEILIVENFLKKWAEIHKMLPQNEEIKTPTFYYPDLKIHEPLPSYIISQTENKNGVLSTVFEVTTKDANFSKELALLCVEDAERKLNLKMGSDFSLVVKKSSEIIKVESCSKSGYNMQGLGLKNQITRATWNDFGAYEVAFHEGNKPVLVSCWIGFVADVAHVMAVPCPKENAFAVIVVSPPLEIKL
ncbi:anthranilate N-benzoyltransferase protein 2-like [Gastrolobium bilobum]|uniref:anthranilate N-benzoyltransferase protein 2-like n=1 Tax=Gastrolobium bilobum TaxID=150636 RepID=UPI002AB303A1|nr:anthranilate N-benzoyltransferase protein 2-like [Gastrolobium bilobum]